MKEMCAYVPGQQIAAAKNSLVRFYPSAEFVDVSGSDLNYYRAIAERWTAIDDLIILEQDIQITTGVIESLSACPELWCVVPYALYETEMATFSLGCARFSAKAQKLIAI